MNLTPSLPCTERILSWREGCVGRTHGALKYTAASAFNGNQHPPDSPSEDSPEGEEGTWHAHSVRLGGRWCRAGQLHELAILFGLHQAMHIVVVGVVPHTLGLQIQGVGVIVGSAVLGSMTLLVASTANMPTYQAHPQILHQSYQHSDNVAAGLPARRCSGATAVKKDAITWEVLQVEHLESAWLLGEQ